MAQEWKIRYLLIDKQGNFGSIDPDPPAAMRYTEARLHRHAMEMLEDLDLDTVDWQPNFDETVQEPRVLPAKFPQPAGQRLDGIAVGMASSMAPAQPGGNLRCDRGHHRQSEPDAHRPAQAGARSGLPTGGTICGRRAGGRSVHERAW